MQYLSEAEAEHVVSLCEEILRLNKARHFARVQRDRTKGTRQEEARKRIDWYTGRLYQVINHQLWKFIKEKAASLNAELDLENSRRSEP